MRRLQDGIEAIDSRMIWDLPLRLFHWSMVLVVFVAAVTGYFFEDWWLEVHVYAGYALGCLLAFRLLWGFTGSYYSRFKTFPLNPRQALLHLQNIITGKSEDYSGHNPIGAWMIVILLTTLVLLVLSGMIVWGGEENQGPLASVISYSIGDATEDIHESLAGILMSVIAIHLLGVLVETKLFKHPVLTAMISGKKPSSDKNSKVNVWVSVWGAFLFIFLTAGIVIVGSKMSDTPRSLVVSETYQRECGDCHPAYHPSLRTASNWHAIINNLSDHYGEDASLDQQTTAEISQFLQDNNAQSSDTKVAHRIGRHDTPTLRMTDTRYWQKKHDEIKSDDFRRPAIGSKINCNACHLDADTGQFSDRNIKLPKGVKS